MSSETALIAVAVTWASIGVTLAIVMGRRGYDSFAWLVMGAIFGPFGIAMAVDAWRHPRERGVTRVLRRAAPTPGAIDALVGIDGSEDSRAALLGTLSLFGDRLHRVAIATVIPFDAASEAETIAISVLEREAEKGPGRHAGLQVLRGKPGEALVEAAETGGYDVIAIGTRGKGLTPALLGSVANELSQHSPVPVLMFSGARATSSHRAPS